MLTPELLISIGKWSGILTLVCAAIAILAFGLKWSFRFRLVGATGFMGVLTAGIFALSLGLFTREVIPGAVKFTRVYDNGGAQTVIAVAPTISESELNATLLQAASDLFSPGRMGTSKLVIRARTIIHPEPGVSQPLFLGEIRRSLTVQNDEEMAIEIYPEKLALLPKPTSSS